MNSTLFGQFHVLCTFENICKGFMLKNIKQHLVPEAGGMLADLGHVSNSRKKVFWIFSSLSTWFL